MADGLNDARAWRVTELLNDFRTIQHQISQIQGYPTVQEYYEIGYETLRQCHSEAQALLTAAYNPNAFQGNGASPEHAKRQLQSVLLDAGSRRFQAQKIYQRASAALRWMNARAAILQGQQPHAGHTPALQQAEYNLRVELTTVTDQYVYNYLHSKDVQLSLWVAEDPTLQSIYNWIHTH
ncbi:hypothetical protein MMC14_000778 [Varicellaria rhodocarpa]|nr:hypothetical protein [Varicellaria rhodocarpa]